MTWIREVYLRGHRRHRLRLIAVSHSPYWPWIDHAGHTYRRVAIHADGRWICESVTDDAPERVVKLTGPNGDVTDYWIDATGPLPSHLAVEGLQYLHIGRCCHDGAEEYRRL